MTEQQQQQQQQQQPSSQPSDSQHCQSPALQSPCVELQPGQSPIAQPLENTSSTSGIATQHFELAQPAEQFDIASDRSAASGSASDDLDDEYWWAELKRSASPDGGSPAKRRRPG